MWAEVADVEAVIGDSDVSEYTPKGRVFADVIQVHLDSAASEIMGRLTEGGWVVPIPNITVEADAWLTAAQVSITMLHAQLARGGGVDTGEESNVQIQAASYRDMLVRIAAGAPIANMSLAEVLTFEAIVDEVANPYDLSSRYRLTR